MSSNGGGYSVRLTIPAKAEYVVLGRLALTSFAGLRSLGVEELADLKLALTEACTNVVQHAYGEGEGVVEILYELLPDRLVVEVSDSGDGFSPLKAGTLDPERASESGLGLAIIRALSDELEVVEREGGGSTLRFVKLLGRSSSG